MPRRILIAGLTCLLAVGLWWAGSHLFGRWKLYEIQPVADHAFKHLAAISPDGSRVAILHAVEASPFSPASEITFTIDLHELATSKTLASISLPPMVPKGSWYVPTNGIQFCDHGSLLLVYLQSGIFAVLDAGTLQPLHTISVAAQNHPSGPGQDNEAVGMACAANASAAIFVHGPQRSSTTAQIFDLRTGQQTGQIANPGSTGTLLDVGISASGANAFLAMQPGPYASSELVLLNLTTQSVAARIASPHPIAQTAFAGEDSLALAYVPQQNEGKLLIELRDIHTGAVTQTFGDSQNGARASVGVSADGQTLMAYTGAEDLCESCPSSHHGQLQIHSARFTLWNRSTSAIRGTSPALHILKTASESFDLNPWDIKISLRPHLEISQSGNAVLVTYPGWNEPMDIYLLRR